MKIPHSTYRVQFHSGFSFRDLSRQLSYLQQLGIGAIYASPVFKAVPDSLHGYDGTAPELINPQLGSIKQLLSLKAEISNRDMQWLQDIVPNHLAFHKDNWRLMSVLENGTNSPYADYFDTSFSSDYMQGKLMVPILGEPLEQLIDKGELTVSAEKGRFYFNYGEHQLPLSPRSYEVLLRSGTDDTLPSPILHHLDALSVLTASKYSVENWEKWCKKLLHLLNSSEAGLPLSETMKKLNKSEEILIQLAELQHYRLCHWQETDSRINFRRFFTINSLICLNIGSESVFNDVHDTILDLVRENVIDGLRIDHIDGLYNPTGYLRELRGKCPDTFIVVEKILDLREELPEEWNIQGTTGYDFLAQVSNLLTNRKGAEKLSGFYQKFTGKRKDVDREEAEKKRLILFRHMKGELANLCRYLLSIEPRGKIKTFQRNEVEAVIGAMLVHFPVYRLYDEGFPLSPKSYATIHSIFKKIEKENTCNLEVISEVKRCFHRAQTGKKESYRTAMNTFHLRFMQLTGPLTAKGVEDTLMYTNHRMAGHNEVGDHPANTGISQKEFHEAMIRRQKNWPLTLNATSTHDTKRGEDSRARLLVLSSIAEHWENEVGKWLSEIKDSWNQPLPDRNSLYFIFQALFAAYPFGGPVNKNLEERFHQYLEKSLREGKEKSDWAAPDMDFEANMKEFCSHLLKSSGPFRKSLKAFVREVNDFGIINSLTQTLLKFTCPGIPDIYQGTELWDTSFVDPDNRRPVDYNVRRKYLREISKLPTESALDILWQGRSNGKIKLWLVNLLAKLRRRFPAFFTAGEYVPVEIRGTYRRHFLAFSRKDDQHRLIVIVPLHLAAISTMPSAAITGFDWGNTRVILPEGIRSWKNLLNGKNGDVTTPALSDIFSSVPLGVLQTDY